MKRIYLFFIVFLSAMTLNSQTREYENGMIINVFEIKSVEERIQLASALATSEIFICNPLETPGELYVRPNSFNSDVNVYNEIEYLRAVLKDEFLEASSKSKDEFRDIVVSWGQNISQEYYNFLISDMIGDRANHCMDAEPFCTGDVYTFPALNSGFSWQGPNYGCLGTSPTSKHSFWYYMKVGVAGNIVIKLEAGFDVDFALWGPFADEITPCPTTAGQSGLLTAACSSCPNNTSNPEFYPSGNLHDCSYDGAHYEYAHIVNGTVGQYYILLITNYSGGSGNITFQKYSGNGETDCGIMPPLISSNNPVCVGQTIELTAQQISGASYSWTGPGGWTSNLREPTRSNATMAMAGTYSCTITVGSQSSEPVTLDVEVFENPVANFNVPQAVCAGTAMQFTSTSTTNPAGGTITSYSWNFGDGGTASGANVSHTYTAGGNYNVSLSVITGGECINTKTQTVQVYNKPVASANANPSSINYGGTSTLTGSGGNGNYTYQWTPADKVVNPTAATTQTIALSSTTTFTLLVTNPQGGCNDSKTVTVTVSGTGMTGGASVEDPNICIGESTTLHAEPVGGTGNYTYSWTPTTGLNNSTIASPTATPTATTTYTCHISDGQTSTDPNVTINVHPTKEIEKYDTVCQSPGHYYTDHGFNISLNNSTSSPIIETHHDFTNHGCDSTFTIYLTIHPQDIQTLEPITLCPNSSYDFYDQTIVGHDVPNEHHTYIYEGETEFGCYLKHTLEVTVSDTVKRPDYQVTCSEPYTWDFGNGEQQVLYHTGTYKHLFQFDEGSPRCDSLVTLTFFRDSIYEHENIYHTACDHFELDKWTPQWDAEPNSTPENIEYHQTFETNRGKCDSTVYLYLALNAKSISEISPYACDSYTVAAGTSAEKTFTYNNTGTVQNIFETITIPNGNQYECDSIIKMNLELYPYPNDRDIKGFELVVPQGNLSTGRYIYKVKLSGPFYDAHKEDIKYNWGHTDHNNYGWTMEKDYNGEANSILMNIDKPGNDTIWCEISTEFSYFGRSKKYIYSEGYGINEQEAYRNINVRPNPTNGMLYIDFNELKVDSEVNLVIYNSNGIRVDAITTDLPNDKSMISYSMNKYANGMYFIEIVTDEFRVVKKVIKE